MLENKITIPTYEYESLVRAKITLEVVKTVVSRTPGYNWSDILPCVLNVEVAKNAE